jgi:hypothetical protein
MKTYKVLIEVTMSIPEGVEIGYELIPTETMRDWCKVKNSSGISFNDYKLTDFNVKEVKELQ